MKQYKDYSKWVFLAIPIIIIIPVLLNWVLRWEVQSGPIIGGDNGPEIWLAFWGAYLAAIGSLVMAMVALLQNSRIREQNVIKEQYEFECKQYERVESYVLENNSLYKINHLISFCLTLANCNDNNNQQEAYLRVRKDLISYQTRLNTTVVKFEKMRLGLNHSPYFPIIKEYNIVFLELCDHFNEILQRFGRDTSPDYHAYDNELKDFIHNADNRINRLDVSKSLFEAGNDYLDEQLSIIKKLSEQLKQTV